VSVGDGRYPRLSQDNTLAGNLTVDGDLNLVATGTGTGVFTIAAPDSNTNRTLTLPDEAGTVLTNVSSLGVSQLPSQLSVDGGASSGSLDIDSNSRVTMPNQPLVIVSNTSTNTGTITGGVVKLDRTSMYNGSNGRFTAPVSGDYFCSITTYAGGESDVFEVSIRKNGSTYTNLYQKNFTGGDFEGKNGSVIVNLSAGDYITFRNGKGSIRDKGNDFRCVYLLG